MRKKDIRKIFLEKRANLSDYERSALSKKITDIFLQNFDLENVKTVHIFLPIVQKGEIDTSSLIDYFWKKNIKVFVPKISDEKIVSIPYHKDSKLIFNKCNIPEPNESPVENISFDMVITPLLYCDRTGNRVGYGKGFYDAFFMQPAAKYSIKIGLNYFRPDFLVEDNFSEDVKLDFLVLPTEMVSFGLTSTFTK